MKSKRVNVFVIDNRIEFRRKLELVEPEMKDINMGIDRTVNSKRPGRKVA